LGALLLAWGVLGLLPAAARAGEKLVPADASQMTRRDALGFEWDPNSQGVLRDGSDDCFDAAMALEVDGQHFAATSPPRRTADGAELVLDGGSESVGVRRRLRLDAAHGALRYLEVIENRQDRARHVTVSLVSLLGSGASGVVTDTGRQFGSGPLQDGEAAVLAVHTNSGNRRPGVLWQLATAGSVLRPQVRVEGSRRFVFTWSLDLKPHERATLLHTVMQRHWAQVPQAAQVQALLAPVLDAAWIRDLAPILRRTLRNYLPRGGTASSLVHAPTAGRELFAFAKAEHVERGAQAVLVVGGSKAVTGRVDGGPLHLTTPDGELDLDLADVAAVRGGASRARPLRVYLRDGEVLAGTLRAPSLGLTAEAGLRLPLDPAALDALFLPSGDRDGVPAAGADAFVARLDGSKLAVRAPDGGHLPAATPWGQLDLPFEEIVRLHRVSTPHPALWALLRDGSAFPLALPSSRLVFTSLRFGRIELDPARLADWSRPPGPEPDASGRTHVQLAGNLVLVGTLTEGFLHVESPSGTVPVALGDVKRIDRATGDDETALFEISLASGTHVGGRLREAQLEVRTPHGTCHVPADQLESYEHAEPAADGEAPK
jgi:hypothetical protein